MPATKPSAGNNPEAKDFIQAVAPACAAIPCDVQRAGRIISLPSLGGLLHCYIPAGTGARVVHGNPRRRLLKRKTGQPRKLARLQIIFCIWIRVAG
jgi:hypothetical protein